MIGLADSISVESVVLILYINENGIVFAVECTPNWRGPMIRPDDFIQQVICTEDFVKQETRICIRVPVEMKIKSAIRSKQVIHYSKPLIKEVKIRIEIGPMIIISV